MKRIHFIVDIRRHRGDSNFIIGLINRFMAGLPVVAVEWLVGPDQAALVPGQSVLAQADSNDHSWANGIATRIRQLSQSGPEGLEFMVLSYDGYLLNAAERLVYSDNLRIKTKHLGDLMKNSWTLQQTGGPVQGVPGMPVLPAYAVGGDRRAAPPPSGVSRISADEAVELLKTMLRRGEYVHRGHAIPQKDVRVYMAAMDPRAAKVPGDFDSESLVKNIVGRGLREGWLARFDRIPGKSGSEMVYLMENQPASSVPVPQPLHPIVEVEAPKPVVPEAPSPSIEVTPPVVETAAPEIKAEETAPVVESPKRTKDNLPERTALMEQAIQDEMIGSLTETREYFLDAIESILNTKGDEVLVLGAWQE